MRRISLPKLRHLKIENYKLYPGPDGQGGLEWHFKDGVTVIAGLNGLGKTTLLNMILKSILGPRTLRSGDSSKLGLTAKYELTKPSRDRFFSGRVTDRAASATVSISYDLGSVPVVLKRSLSDLRLLECSVNRIAKHQPDEIDYLEEVGQLAGVADGYEFFVLVRNLLFFLEDRSELLWQREAQFEIFRILFVQSADLSAALRESKSKVLEKDSKYRNVNNAINSLEQKFDLGGDAESDLAERIEKLNSLNELISSLTGQNAELEDARGKLVEAKQKCEEAKLRVSVELAAKHNEIKRGYDNYLRTIMPDMSKSAAHVLYQLVSENACTVCGSHSDSIRERWDQLISSGTCPVCLSTSDEQEPQAIPIDEIRLKKLISEGDELKQQVSALDDEFDEIENGIAETSAQINKNIREITESRGGFGGGQLPDDLDAYKSQIKKLQQHRGEVEVLKSAINHAAKEYRELVQQAVKDITDAEEQVRNNFSRYAKAFLAENVELEYSESNEIRLGQIGGKMASPSFIVTMTSGVSGESLLPRSESDMVSESQKEFLDLAFRLALVEAIGCHSLTMVIETPEASLDSVFIKHAADMLRAFSGGGDEERQRQVLTSCNLAGNEMIPALLGLLEDQKHRADPTETESHVINLLNVAAESKALKENRAEYDQLFARATGIELNA